MTSLCSKIFFIFLVFGVLSTPISPSWATGLSCVKLFDQSPNLPAWAENLVRFRQEVLATKDLDKKRLLDLEFKAKFNELVTLTADEIEARNLYQRAQQKVNAKTVQVSQGRRRENQIREDLKIEKKAFIQWQHFRRFDSYHSSFIQNMFFTPDGRFLITADRREMKILDLTTMTELPAPIGPFATLNTQLSPDGKKLLVLGNNSQVFLIDMDRFAVNEVPILKKMNSIKFTYFTPDSQKLILVGEAQPSLMGHAVILDLNQKTESSAPTGNSSQILSGLVTPDGQRLITFGVASDVKMMNLADQSEIVIPPVASWFSSVHWSAVTPDNATLAIGTNWGEIKFIDLKNLTETLAPMAPNGGFTQFVMSPDGGLLATARRKNLRFFDLHTRREPGFQISQLPGEISKMSFSHDGQRLIILSENGLTGALDLSSGEFKPAPYRLSPGQGLSSMIAESSDGSKIATTDDQGHLVIWFRDADEGERFSARNSKP